MRTAKLATIVFFAGWMLAGMIVFRDAPIFRDGDGYRGKHGDRHSRENYVAHEIWRWSAIPFAVFAFLSMAHSVATERDDRRLAEMAARQH